MADNNPNQCCYETKAGKQCSKFGLGDPPLCAWHEKHRAEISKQASQNYNELIDFVLDNPTVKKGVNKVNTLIDKLGSVIDMAKSRVESGGMPVSPQTQYQQSQEQKAKLAMLQARMIMQFDMDEVLTVEKVKQRYKALALIVHPDRPNGSMAAMQKLNAANDLLMKSLGG